MVRLSFRFSVDELVLSIADKIIIFINRISGRFSVQKEKLQNQGPQSLRISAGKIQGRSLHRKILERDEEPKAR